MIGSGEPPYASASAGPLAPMLSGCACAGAHDHELRLARHHAGAGGESARGVEQKRNRQAGGERSKADASGAEEETGESFAAVEHGSLLFQSPTAAALGDMHAMTKVD